MLGVEVVFQRKANSGYKKYGKKKILAVIYDSTLALSHNYKLNTAESYFVASLRDIDYLVVEDGKKDELKNSWTQYAAKIISLSEMPFSHYHRSYLRAKDRRCKYYCVNKYGRNKRYCQRLSTNYLYVSSRECRFRKILIHSKFSLNLFSLKRTTHFLLRNESFVLKKRCVSR